MDEILSLINYHIVDPFILNVDPNLALHNVDPSSSCRWSGSYSLTRQFFVLWGFLYISSLIIYFLSATTTFLFFYTPSNNSLKIESDPSIKNLALWKWDNNQIFNEIFVSTWSLCIMAGMTVPIELFAMCGHGHVYYKYDEYGIVYLVLSPILFLIFTDTLIYWIHRALHWPSFYWLHKLHHHYKETTPYSAFSFHPVDGFAQGLPYHLFILFFPMYSYLYAATLGMVGLWTVNIHDRVTLRLWGVNGAAHHTIHHTKFNYNYGQYFTFWDKVFGTFRDPFETEEIYQNTSVLGFKNNHVQSIKKIQ